MPMVMYTCPDPNCGCEREHFYHRASDAPATMQCDGVRLLDRPSEKVERKINNPDGTITIELEEVGQAPALEPCTAVMLQRETWFDPSWARPARGFEPLVIFERADYDTASPEFKRGHQKYYIPGRNYEPTEPGMKRIEITNMAEYNRAIRDINRHEVDKMRDHRAMHAEYWKARRKALREDVDARVGPQRSHPLVRYLTQVMRRRSDQKSAVRYGKPLNANFHAQLIEFNQGSIQDYCDADTGWKSQRAR